ncbi:MAG: helicase [Caldilineae bacterium]|nr:MAG: helicase [Caldilineae bacterium]
MQSASHLPHLSLRDIPFLYSYGPNDDRLHNFYIPALKASVRYDRMTGYFSSTSLAVAAAGVAHLIANRGQMRLLVGAQLYDEDVEAIQRGETELEEVVARRMEAALTDPDTLSDEIQRARLEALAWMVARGQLTIRVVLPAGENDIPLPADRATDYFHPKEGIFTDAEGNQVAFSGSINESVTGWERNYEQFMVFVSWTAEGGRIFVAEAKNRFQRLWEQREPGWISLPIPEAARRRLLRFTPARPPTRDPLEHGPRTAIAETPAVPIAYPREQERTQIVLRYLRDGPHLLGATGLGMSTCAVEPWPHQRFVLRRVLSTFPQRCLIADEVGLGKTIEAGLILRQLTLSGLVRRALILAPKSVLRQWQEELYEKFSLNVPRYDGRIFVDYFGEEIPPSTPNLWDTLPVVLASSQLVKRAERRQTLLEARPWDMVIVDEAHHARRRDFLNLDTYRPNRLLELLLELQERTDMLLLLTATPMQVHPVEVWDLLSLLGLSGRWGVDARSFLAFFTELQKPPEAMDEQLVLDLIRAELAVEGLDERLAGRLQQQLGPVQWQQVRNLLDKPTSGRPWRQLSPQAQQAVVQLARRHTPLRRLVLRHTRQLLRRYREQGLLQANATKRDPSLCWIPMSPPERELYDRIEEYISRFYSKYEGERKGLGFVMTVYRRRLTSSFYAVRRSLERRLAFLRGAVVRDEEQIAGLDLDDLEQDDLSYDVGEQLSDVRRDLFAEEEQYVEDFLSELRGLGEQDSKSQRLLSDLRTIFRRRDTVLIFTQYTDTMDYLRERLRAVYGSQVACYSGRGGERWDGVMWVPVSKEEIKNAFRRGEEVKILLCTEAASEGLNLQTCGVLINYDMPWNPMRVEQRIGRIDRIGQRFDTVWVYNYFYEDTVEASVYQALANRIDWFRNVMGATQPILARVDRLIQTLAMTPGQKRAGLLQQELQRLEQDMATTQSFDLDAWLEQDVGREDLPAPFSLAEVGVELTTLPGVQQDFRPHETIKNAYWLRRARGEEAAVTFDPDTADAHPNSVQLLTYGNPLWDELLDRVLSGEGSVVEANSEATGVLLRLETASAPKRTAWYVCQPAGEPRRIVNLADLREAIDRASELKPWDDSLIDKAKQAFIHGLKEEQERIQAARARLVRIRQLALEAKGRRLVEEAALTLLALRQQTGLFDQNLPPIQFDESAVQALAGQGYPFAPLLKKLGTQNIRLRPTDPFYLTVQKTRADSLRQRLEQLKTQGKTLLRQLSKTTGTGTMSGGAPSVTSTVFLLTTQLSTNKTRIHE